jgi:hypothetical protein
MASDGAGAPAGFGWGGGGPGWSGSGPGLAAVEAAALAWPRPCLAAARSWGSRSGDGDWRRARVPWGSRGGDGDLGGGSRAVGLG